MTDGRRLIILLFDVSGSMGVARARVRPIDELNTHLARWLPTVRERAAGDLGDAEFAVITFGAAEVILWTPAARVDVSSGVLDPGMFEDGGAFMPAAELAVDIFAAAGTTPLVSALRAALALGDGRAEVLARRRIDAGAVRLILFTDGAPNDRNLPHDAWRTVAGDLASRRSARRTELIAFGVPGSDAQVLTALAGDDGYFPLAGFDFERLLSLVLVASSADDPYDRIRGVIDGAAR